MDISEMEDNAISLSRRVASASENSQSELLSWIKELNLFCTRGNNYQNLIANTNKLIERLNSLVDSDNQELKLKSFQLLANLCVQNQKVQDKVFEKSEKFIMLNLEQEENSKCVNVAAMIIHNSIINNNCKFNLTKTLSVCLAQSFRLDPLPDFVHILLDHLICNHENIREEFNQLSDQHKKNFLLYVNNHVQNEEAELLHQPLIKHLSLEFKKKSDCILKTISSFVESIDPEQVVILLDIISIISSQQKYQSILKDDHALFLNLGCLLQTIHKVGKNSSNIFTPIQKLDALLPSAPEKSAIESEISFSFKTKLIQALGNLCHKNQRNQELAREMEIMQSIFECTNVDARNPLIKEWSILAIRNLCEDNLENQEIVRQLTRLGEAENPILNEFGVDSGVFRIKKV